MSWTLQGTYFENCSCDTICPCTWSGLTAHATGDRCLAVLAFHVDRGEVEGTDVSGRTFALVVDSPPVMSDGGWKVGILLDAAASGPQAAALGRVIGGELGGPPAMLGPLVGEMAGIESAPCEWRERDGTFAVRFGDLVDIEVDTLRTPDLDGPVQLANILHPANSTLTVSPATRSSVDAFGIRFDGTGSSGFNAPFNWAA